MNNGRGFLELRLLLWEKFCDTFTIVHLYFFVNHFLVVIKAKSSSPKIISELTSFSVTTALFTIWRYLTVVNFVHVYSTYPNLHRKFGFSGYIIG